MKIVGLLSSIRTDGWVDKDVVYQVLNELEVWNNGFYKPMVMVGPANGLRPRDIVKIEFEVRKDQKPVVTSIEKIGVADDWLFGRMDKYGKMLLPPGIMHATLEEVETRSDGWFTGSQLSLRSGRRKVKMHGIGLNLKNLKAGDFITVHFGPWSGSDLFGWEPRYEIKKIEKQYEEKGKTGV